MSDAPKLIPYIVAATFDNGGLCVTAIFAPAVEVATAIATREFVRSVPEDALLTGICGAQITPEFLRAALRAVEGEPQAGRVVSLVSSGAPVTAIGQPPEMPPSAAEYLREQAYSLGGLGSRDDEPPAA
jgi:hypothetical protein